MSLEVIDMKPKLLKKLSKSFWCDMEQPIVAVNEQHRYGHKNNYVSGAVILTRGSIYLFESNWKGKLELKHRYNLLDVRTLKFNRQELEFTLIFDNFEITIDPKQRVRQVAFAMVYILNEATYGLKNLQTLRVEPAGELNDATVSKRPPNALKWRALMLAHFYGITGEQLHTIDYFDKWEANREPYIALEPNFHPGNFAAAFGHALAWESTLKAVVFVGFAPTKMAQFLDSLVDNAVTIKSIVFVNYSGKRMPNFSGRRISSSSVKRYVFERCPGSIVADFLSKTMNYPQIEYLVLDNITTTSEEFSTFIDLITDANNKATHEHLKDFAISNTKITNFPTQDISRLLEIMPHLSYMSIRCANGDADRFLRACFRGQTAIKFLRIGGMAFKTPFDDGKVKVPKSLVGMDLSGCKFSAESLAGLLRLLTSQQMDQPVVLEMRHLTLPDNAFDAFSQLNYEACLPNIAEFIFSNNEIPDQPSQFLFAFLFTQKRLRLLSFKDITAGNPIQFLKYLLQLCGSIALPGLDISGNFDAETFGFFLSALNTTGCAANFRRLDVSGSKSGTGGMGALNELLKSAPNLNEVGADGFQSDNPAALYALWSTISQHPSISSCDLPVHDMKTLQVTKDKTPPEFQEVYKSLAAKPRLSISRHRVDYAIDLLTQGSEYTSSPEIFRLAAAMKCDDVPEFGADGQAPE